MKAITSQDALQHGLQDQHLATLEHLLAIDSTDQRQALDEASDLLAATFAAEKIDAFLYDASVDTLIAGGTSSTPMGHKQHALGLDRLPLANGGRVVETYRTGQPFLNGRADEDPHELRGIVDALGVRSMALAPIFVQGALRGVLSVVSPRPDYFTTEDLRLTVTAARWLGLLIHRAELGDRVATQAAEQARRTTANELIAVLAHDLRNYLSPMRGRTDLLRRWATRENQPVVLRHSDDLVRSVDRLARLVDDLLDSARLEHGLLALNFSTLDLAELARSTATSFQTGEHEVLVQTGPAEVLVSADADRTRQALENLVSNALKFSPPGAVVTVRVNQRMRGDDVWGEIAVSDQGPGIPPELQSRIFDRFARGADQPGLGLGLYLARSIAEAHRGQLTVASAPGEGACFTLSLPATPSL